LEEIRQWLVQNKSLLQERYQVRELGIFGSYIRQEQTQTSDVDSVDRKFFKKGVESG
jgi:uncharacterized protein